MITLFELAEYNATKKNYTRRINKTHKDIEAFLMVSEYFSYLNLCNGYINQITSYFDFWREWLTDDKGNEYSYLNVTPNALDRLK